MASTIGKFYATYWLVMRAVGKLGGAVDLMMFSNTRTLQVLVRAVEKSAVLILTFKNKCSIIDVLEVALYGI